MKAADGALAGSADVDCRKWTGAGGRRKVAAVGLPIASGSMLEKGEEKNL